MSNELNNSPGETFRTFKMLAIGGAPAAVSYCLYLAGEATDQILLFIASFAIFGVLTPMVVANAKRIGSVVVALLLAAAFLGSQSGVTSEGMNLMPWFLFACGLFPSLAITLAIRLSVVKYLPYTLPLALFTSVVALVLMPASYVAGISLALLLADMLVLRKFGKLASEPPKDSL